MKKNSMPLRNIMNTLQPRPWWNESSRNAKASDIWKLLSKCLPWSMIYCAWAPSWMCQDLRFIWFECSKGTWSQLRINYLFKCRTIPSFIWICWGFCFSFFLLLQLEKCSIMWNRSYPVKSFESILKPHCKLAWCVAYFGGWEGL